MKLPRIGLQKIMVAYHIAYLQECCKNGIEPAELVAKIDELRHVFRAARFIDQMDYWNNCLEAMDILTRKPSRENCKMVMKATLFDLMCHLEYLNLKFPDE